MTSSLHHFRLGCYSRRARPMLYTWFALQAVREYSNNFVFLRNCLVPACYSCTRRNVRPLAKRGGMKRPERDHRSGLSSLFGSEAVASPRESVQLDYQLPLGCGTSAFDVLSIRACGVRQTAGPQRVLPLKL